MTIHVPSPIEKRIDALERRLKHALARIRALEKRPPQMVTVKHVGGWNP